MAGQHDWLKIIFSLLGQIVYCINYVVYYLKVQSDLSTCMIIVLHHLFTHSETTITQPAYVYAATEMHSSYIVITCATHHSCFYVTWYASSAVLLIAVSKAKSHVHQGICIMIT